MELSSNYTNQTISFSQVGESKSLRLNEEYFDFYNFVLPNFYKKFHCTQFKSLRDFKPNIRNGKDISKESYAPNNTDYIYLTVNNVRKGEFCFDEIIYIEPEKGNSLEDLKLKKGDLIVTRSGSVGFCKLFDINDENKYIPSGYIIVVSVNNRWIIPQFLEFYLSTEFSKRYFEVRSSGKTQKNISQPDVLSIPIPLIPENKQIEVVDHIDKEILSKIRFLEEKIELLQNIIDDVLVENGVKQDKFRLILQEVFSNRFEGIGKNSFLRTGAQYHAFYAVHNSLLFDSVSKSIPIRKLGTILKPYKNCVLKKGILDDEYILLDLEQLEPKSGTIKTEDNIVTEIGSDKVMFGDADIVISKIDPYLAYVFVNDKEKKYIGTTELLSFKLIDKEIDLQYLKYILLSYDYIQKSGLLMYGKRHPRIHRKDLLAIKVPTPNFTLQQKIVAEIQKRENKSNRYKQEIKTLREQIDDIIYQAIE
jgi:restriction endonuclease S subunit